MAVFHSNILPFPSLKTSQTSDPPPKKKDSLIFILYLPHFYQWDKSRKKNAIHKVNKFLPHKLNLQPFLAEDLTIIACLNLQETYKSWQHNAVLTDDYTLKSFIGRIKLDFVLQNSCLYYIGKKNSHIENSIALSFTFFVTQTIAAILLG